MALDPGFCRWPITGLEAVETPMTIMSYSEHRRKALVVPGGIAATLLHELDGSGVVGLGLAVGPLRRPFASEAALLGPEDWHGARFRAFNSPVQADTSAHWAGPRSILASAGSTRSPLETCAVPSSTSPNTRPMVGARRPATSPETSCCGRRCSS